MRIRRADGFWVWEGGPVPPGAAAITVGRLVSVRARAVGNRHLMAHEAEHVRQFAERGLAGFLVRYLADYARLRAAGWPHWSAYRRLPLEVDAEWRARRPDLAPD